ncbi:bifunctional folylpolyglutamate synthase/dihydrofolate synthase [Vicingaceae bacterium]|nr:bifunctional folylpolyglutamate synthase/dihydrofolate synthase [Vicingaceae bacterium]
MNYKQTLDYLFKQLPMYQRQGKSAFKKDLSNTISLCKILENPQNKFKSIHVAGTNGKGSSAHMIASIFQEASYKTGLYTSPHLKDFRERIRINGNMISGNQVVDFVAEYENQFKNINPSFFEWTVALAFHCFATEKVDIAIIETGLGGRLDSTNIIQPELCLITNIGFDHMDMLGNTLKEIAGEKAGIIKANTPVIVSNHSGQRQVFEEKAKKLGSPIIFTDEMDTIPSFESDLTGTYQKENIRGIYFTCLEAKKLGWNLPVESIKRGFLKVVKNTHLRGRWEILQENPVIIADTAHNKEGLQLVLSQLQALNAKQYHFVIGFVKDKNVEEVLQLFPKNANYYFCKADIPRALPINDLKLITNKLGYEGHYFNTVKEAFELAKTNCQEAEIVYVGGSNFVVAEIL